MARLVDYCLGGDLEWTPAIQQEFVAAELSLTLGAYDCTIERSAVDTQAVRVSWSGPGDEVGSLNAPLRAQDPPLVETAAVHNFSDLVFHLCGTAPIKVRRRRSDPESPLIRLSLRDIWTYCYLDQLHLDSSFYRLEDPFRGRKSQDAMRFFTGLHSDRLSQLETELFGALDDQRAKREAVEQIRAFMSRFELGSELDVTGQITEVMEQLASAEQRRAALESTRRAEIHPTDALREQLRRLSAEVEELQVALADSEESIAEQVALKAELITAKVKAERADQAGRILEGVSYERCPECGTDVSNRTVEDNRCRLCGNPSDQEEQPSLELEALRRDLNGRIDELTDSVRRRRQAAARTRRQLQTAQRTKQASDARLQEELAVYDSAFVESIRGVERDVATLTERLRSLRRLQEMPQAITALEEQSGSLQGRIDVLRSQLACTAPGSLDTHLCYAAWRSSYSSRASIGV